MLWSGDLSGEWHILEQDENQNLSLKPDDLRCSLDFRWNAGRAVKCTDWVQSRGQSYRYNCESYNHIYSCTYNTTLHVILIASNHCRWELPFFLFFWSQPPLIRIALKAIKHTHQVERRLVKFPSQPVQIRHLSYDSERSIISWALNNTENLS